MKAPKCRLCETLHWNHEPHKFPDDIPNSIPNTCTLKEGSRKVVEPAVSCVSPTSLVISARKLPRERTKEWKLENREAYNAYQREYMRKRRAKPATA